MTYRKHLLMLAIAVWLNMHGYAQTDSIPDTAIVQQRLEEVTVNAYGSNGELTNIASPVANVNQHELQRFSNNSILPAVNNIPGVRMEERSPGSYRFAIRGSSVNSPFGVRNVKVYYNGLPFTDAGGSTYLNQLGFYSIQQVTVIKEPGSSLYGAGTGGVLHLNSIDQWQQGFKLNMVAGSYATYNLSGEVNIGDSLFKNSIRYQHLQSDGYRSQSAMRKDVASWDAVLKGNKSQLKADIVFGNLYYQTPGGLTQAEYETDRRQARPRAGATPGAAEQKAAITQKMLWAGISYRYTLNEHWMPEMGVCGSYIQLQNPTIRNYSHVAQAGTGGRATITYTTQLNRLNIRWITGSELQYGASEENTYGNILGTKDTLQQKNEVITCNISGFSQLGLQVGKWDFSAGASLNNQNVSINKTYPAVVNNNRDYNNQLMPRFALLYKMTAYNSIYVSVAKGYSPPTTEQILPTGGALNSNLNAARGWNYNIGTKGYVLDNNLFFDVNLYHFDIENMIVQRRDSAGGDYYTNAGSIQQNGIELLLKYDIMTHPEGFVNRLSLTGSYSYSLYTYKRFRQLDIDYSDNQLPGTPRNVINMAMDASTRFGIYINLNCSYNDKIYLNDANTQVANAYTIIDIKTGYNFLFRRDRQLQVYIGCNNLLNEKYSLGNDINAAGGRYYNAAPGINYYTGLSISL